MADLSMNGRLPSDDRNGLPSIVTDLLARPTQVRPVVALVDVSKITEDPATGQRIPQVRIRAIEPIIGPDAKEIDRMLRRAVERRTGAQELPLEMEREIEDLLDGLGDDTVDEGPDEGPGGSG